MVQQNFGLDSKGDKMACHRLPQSLALCCSCREARYRCRHQGWVQLGGGALNLVHARPGFSPQHPTKDCIGLLGGQELPCTTCRAKMRLK